MRKLKVFIMFAGVWKYVCKKTQIQSLSFVLEIKSGYHRIACNLIGESGIKLLHSY